MRLILNILWFVLGGWVSLLGWALAGVLLAITIVGLPWALAAFRIAGFSAWPFGRHLVPASGPMGQGVLNPVLNVVWFVLAGWWLALGHLVWAVAAFVSIIGIPFGLQHLKLAMISLAPVGARIEAR